MAWFAVPLLIVGYLIGVRVERKRRDIKECFTGKNNKGDK